MTTSRQPTQTVKKTVIIIFIIYFLQGFVHNLGHPVTPKLVQDMGIPDYYFGLYFAAMSLGLLLGGPIWGVLGDRGNKRLYIVVGLLVYSIGQYAFAFVGNQNVMILMRFISGFGVSASVTLIMSHLIEHSSDEHRTVFLGWYQALFVLGTSLGYFVGGNLPQSPFFIELWNTDDLRNIFLIQAILNVIHATYIFFLIKTEDKPKSKDDRKLNPFRGFAQIRTLDRNLKLFFVSLAMISLGAINVTKYIEVFMNAQHFSTGAIGNFVGVTGVVSLISTIVLVPVVARMKKDFTIMIAIQFISAVVVFTVFRSNQLLVMLYSVFMLYIILKAVYTPLEQHYISSQAKPGEYGTMMGVRQSFFAVGLVLGPLLGGFLYDLKPIYVFDFSVLMFFLGGLLLLVVGQNLKQQNAMN